MPEVTIIIPNYNGKTYLETCLASLRTQTIRDFRILVVDNGSTDDSLTFLAEQYPKVGVLALDKNYGFSAAVNRGIQAANTPYVLLLNNDTEAESGFVEALLSGIRRSPRIFSCQAKILDYNNREFLDGAGDFYCVLGWAFARGKGQPEQYYDKRERIFASCAGAAIYRREIFEEIGYFDERHFAYLEDMDVGYRARIRGYENYFEPAARVYHMGSATTGSRYNALKVRLSARNNIYLAYKNMPLPQLLCNSPMIFFGILVKLLFFKKRGLGKEYRLGISQGVRLCSREYKVRYCRRYRRNYWKIQMELWKNLMVGLRKI